MIRVKLVLAFILVGLSVNRMCAHNPSIGLDSDSLLQVLRTLPQDSTRLLALKQIIQIEQSNDKCIKYADMLLQEANQQKNSKYISYAAYYHIVYYYNRTKQDSITKWIQIMKPHAEVSNLWDVYFDAKRLQIDIFTFNANYELAISEANLLKVKALKVNSQRGIIAAYQCLSNAYAASQRMDESLKALKKAHELLTKESHPITHISILTQLTIMSQASDSLKELFVYVQELEEVLNRYIQTNPSLKLGVYDIFLFKEMMYGHYYLSTNELKKAFFHLKQAENYLTPNSFFAYKAFLYEQEAGYYEEIGKFKQAVLYTDSALELYKSERQGEYAENLLQKGRLINKMGQKKQAISLFREALELKDSINTAISKQQMEQIKSHYKSKKEELSDIKEKNEIHLLILLVGGILLGCSLFFMFRLIKTRKELQLSENETRRALQIVTETNDLKNRFLSNMSYNIRTPLNNVVGFSQLIASDPNLDEQTLNDFSTIIHQSSENLMELVNDVLELSRLEAGMTKFQLQPYDILDLCKDALYMARQKNEGTNIQINYVADIKSHVILTDVGRLTSAILSTLTYRHSKPEEKQEVTFRISYSPKHRNIEIRLSNSPLVQQTPTQEKEIKHEINHLLLAHFKGSYQVITTPEGETDILFSYPIESDLK